jgi:CBS domain containing-hemolysin-like protein
MITPIMIVLMLVPAAISVAGELIPSATYSIDWPKIASMLTPIVLFLMGLLAKPLLENTVNAKIDEIEKRFVTMEHDAHADIIKSIERSSAEFGHHNMDGFAHPNLIAFEKLGGKLDSLAIELGSLRTDVAAMRARVTRPTRGKK